MTWWLRGVNLAPGAMMEFPLTLPPPSSSMTLPLKPAPLGYCLGEGPHGGVSRPGPSLRHGGRARVLRAEVEG